MWRLDSVKPASVFEMPLIGARGVTPRLRVTLQAIDAAGGYAFLVSIQVIERVVAYRKYVELVFDGVLPTTPTASVDPLEIAAAIR